MTSDRSTGEPTSAVVGIGSSAGGLMALQGLFSALPKRTRLCFIVVSHLDPDHESELAPILQRETTLPVEQVRGTVKLLPGHVYVIAPGQELRVRDGTLETDSQSRARGQRAPIDALFHSLVAAHGSRALTMLLSGGGRDGVAGARAVKEAHGLVLVQTPDEAEFPELPRHAISLDLADVVAPVAELAARVAEIAEHGASLPTDAGGLDTRQTDTLRNILAHVRARVGHDFGSYKRSTVLRRLQRRMNATQSRDMDTYLSVLRGSSDEAWALYRDLLISVTNFFRDPDSFDALKEQVIAKLFDGRGADDRVRVWSVGCATGEEAYSVGMLLLEHAATLEAAPRLQVFASDIDQRALNVAREGLYPSSIEENVSAERLRRFFVREGEQYRVGRELRSIVLFARHSVLGDPPFTRMRLVICRNLLIYLQRPLQDKVLAILHYALGQTGYLFLGSASSAESGDGAAQLFRPVDKKHRIYRARGRGHEHALPPSLPLELSDAPDREPEPVDGQRAAPASSYESGLHWRMLENYGPPSVIVDQSYGVVHLSERAGRYLRPPGGTPTHDLLRLARPELTLELRRALHEAFDKGRASVSRSVPIELDGASRTVYLSVRPRRVGEDSEHLALVTFDESESDGSKPSGVDSGHGEAAELEHELTRTRERLQTTLEQFETSQEEMKAQNEELRSINEEYKSTMEELETSKEELHSVNEELQSVNSELEANLEQVSRAHSDLSNLMAATEVGTLFLDRNLRVKRYTENLGSLFNLISSDVGRPIADLSSRLVYDDLEEDARQVLRDLTVLERELYTADDSWHLMRLRPYRTLDDRIDGVVMTLVDITGQRRAMEDQQQATEYADQIIDTVREGLLVLDENLRIESANTSFYNMFALTPGDTEGALVYEVDGGEWDIPDLRRVLEEILPESRNFADFEVRHEFRRFGERVMLLNGRRLEQQGKILLAIEDITERYENAALLEQRSEALELADRRKDDFLAILGHELRNPLAALASGVPLIERGRDEQRRRWALDMVNNQIGMLTSLLDDLLDLSRITHGKIELRKERTDLVQIVTAVLEGVEARTRARIELDAPAELVLNGDPRRLTQVVQNLLSNALRHTADDGHILLEVAERGTSAEVTVTDDGDGIDPGDLESIFERFTQQRPASGGLGIGLALVRELVALHGGTATAESEGPGSGAAFKLTIPLDREHLRASQAREATPTAVFNRARILIADDNETAATGLAALLKNEGADVTLVHDGTSVVGVARELSPTLILLDIGLPDIDGTEVARRLRADARLAEVPLIALTGFAAGRVDGNDRGLFDEWLTKPVGVDGLAGVAARLLAID